MKKPRMQTPVYNLLWKTTYANYTEGYGDLLKDHVFKFTGSKDHVSKPSLYRNDKIYMKKYSKKPHIQTTWYPAVKTTYSNYVEGNRDHPKNHVFKSAKSKDHVFKLYVIRNHKIVICEIHGI